MAKISGVANGLAKTAFRYGRAPVANRLSLSNWTNSKPREPWFVAILSGLFGVILLFWAVQAAGPLRGLAGALILTMALKLLLALIKQAIAAKLETLGWSVAALLLLLGGIVFIWLAHSRDQYLLAIVGTMSLGLSLAPFSLLVRLPALGSFTRRWQKTFSEDDPAEKSWRAWWLATGLFGGAICAVGFLQMWVTRTTGSSFTVTAVIALLVALVGTSFVWRGEALFVGVLLATVLVFSLVDRSAVDPSSVSGPGIDESPTSIASRKLVVFGDSWISGEGAPKYYEGTDVKGGNRNECRRAPSAYSVLLAEGLYGSSNNLDFYACSGAKIHDLINIGDAVATDCGARGKFFGQYPCSPAGIYGRQLQIDNLLIDPTVQDELKNAPEGSNHKDTSNTELVLISIGGNDVGFGQIVQGCLLPGSCVERREIWFDNVKAIGHDLETLYQRIKEEFDGQVPIVVMPYPLVLAENSCSGSPLNAQEHAFIVEFTTLLNHQLQVSASRAGVHFFEEGMFVFESKRACETSPRNRAVNLIALQATDGDFLERVNPKSWPHNSMHPNPTGHQLTYERISKWIQNKNLIAGDELNPEPDAEASLELLSAGSRRLFAVDMGGLFVESTTSTLLGLGCDPRGVDGFASRLRVLDAPESGRTPKGARFDPEEDDVSTLWWPVSISGVDNDHPICFTDQDGQWQRARVGDHSTNDMYGSNGELFLRGRPPNQPDGRSDTPQLQWVLFVNKAQVWELRAIHYCSTDSNCEASFDDWSAAQLARTYTNAAPPLAIVFFGGLMFALGWNMGIWPKTIAISKRYLHELSQVESSNP